MQNPAKVAYAIADLGSLDQGNILDMAYNQAGPSADYAMEAPTPTVAPRPVV